MATNLPQNSTYSGGTTTSRTPSSIYVNLAEMRRQGGSPFAPQEVQPTGTPEYYQGIKNAMTDIYGREANIPPGVPFMESTEPPGTRIPIPPDYSGFKPAGNVPGTNYSWNDPIEPSILNLRGDTQGQYVSDIQQPGALIKSERGNNVQENRAMLNGRPSFLYQSDHIIPLALGGADTMANRQLLTMDQNDKKTKAQAIPYTLYSHGDISLQEARVMAMQWKDRDLTDIPQPDINGLVPIDTARNTVTRWKQPRTPTFKDVMAEIPKAAKDFGKGWLPDPIREFVKGFGSGATMGFLPYEQGEDEDTTAKVAGWGGMLTGGVASFMLGGALVDGALAVGGLGRGALGLLRGKAAIQAAEAGFGAAELAAETGAVGKAAGITFKTLNSPPTYLQKLLTPANVRYAARIGAINAVVGEGNRLTANHLNPDVLSGKRPDTAEEAHIARLLGDIAIGAISGIAPPTIRGAATATMLPTTIAYISDPDHPVNALANGVAFGAMHYIGAPSKKAQFKAVEDAFEETANRAAYNSLSYYAPDVLPELPSGGRVPVTVKTFNVATNAKSRAVENIWKRYFFDKSPDGTPAEGMTLDAALQEVKRVTASAGQLYKGGLATDARIKADIDDLLSFGKMAKDPTKSNLQNRFESQAHFSQPGVARSAANFLDEAYMNNSLSTVNKTPPSGKYVTGDMAVTGAGLDVNTPEAKYFFEQKSKGNASPNILLVDRTDSAPLWRIKNNLLTPEDIKQGLHAPDPHPDNALQAFGIVRNPETKAKELVPLGWVSSEFRLNLGKYAFNKHPAVLKGDYPAIQLHKDQVAPRMRQEEVPVLVANLDPRATPETIEGKRPFIPLTLSDANWEYSKVLSNRIAQSGNQNSLSMNIAQVNNSLNAKKISEVIPTIREQAVNPASELIPRPQGETVAHVPTMITKNMESRLSRMGYSESDINKMKPQQAWDILNAANDTARIPREATRDVLKDVESSLNVDSPATLKTSFDDTFGIKLSDQQAQELYLRRNDLRVKDEVKILLDAVNSGNASEMTRVKVVFMKQYLESDAFRSSEIARVFPELKALGGIENTSTSTPTPSVTPLPLKNTASIKPTSRPPTIETTSPQNVGGLSERITTAAAKESPLIRANSIKMTSPQASASELAKPFIIEGQAMINDVVPRGQGKYQIRNWEDAHNAGVERTLRMAQSNLQQGGFSQKIINEVKLQIREGLGGAQGERLNTLKLPPSLAESKGPENTAVAGGNYDFPSRGSMEVPTVYSKENFASIDRGLQTEKTTPSYWASKTWDEILTTLFGKNYRNNPDAAALLSTKHPSGAGLWNDYLLNDINAAGREITQNKDILAARALGDRNATGSAIEARRRVLIENPSGEAETLTRADIAKLGLEPGAEGVGFEGMRVTPGYQEENMVHGLTNLEDLMGGVSSGIEMSPLTAVNDIKNLFLGSGKGNIGILKYINQSRPAGKKLSIPSKLFAELTKSAKDAEKAATAVEQLRGQYTNLQNILNEHGPDPLYQRLLKETESELARYGKILDSVKKPNGAGGPGYYDGEGGPGWGSGAIDSVMSTVRTNPWGKYFFGDKPLTPTVTPKAPSAPQPTQIEPIKQVPQKQPPAKKGTYLVRGLPIYDDDLSEAAHILYAEISNRPGDRQAFEVRNVLNTALNRMQDTGGKKTLTQILQAPYQYQGYAPNGITVKDGKIVESQYQKIKKGTNLTPDAVAKLNGIKAVLEELKTGKFEDTTSGSKYYVHASDGTMWLGKTIQEAKDNANKHERNKGKRPTSFGTTVGLPAHLTAKR